MAFNIGKVDSFKSKLAFNIGKLDSLKTKLFLTKYGFHLLNNSPTLSALFSSFVRYMILFAKTG
jgi:hypothetical protein